MDSFIVGFLTAIAIAIVLVVATEKPKETKFTKGSKRTITLARLGGYARWDRDGKRYKAGKK